MKIAEQKQARELRRQGKSLTEIASLTGCSKSSISRWTRDIPLTCQQIESLRDKEVQGRLKGRISAATHPNSPKQVWAQKRKKAQAHGLRELPPEPSKQMRRAVIAALYWGEGKKDRNSFSISNTDPLMIRLVLKFLREDCEIPEDRLRFWAQLHPSLDSKKAQKYWARIADTRPSKIKTIQNQNKTNKGKRKGHPYGCLEVSVHDTLFRARVEGWMDRLKEYAGLTQR